MNVLCPKCGVSYESEKPSRAKCHECVKAGQREYRRRWPPQLRAIWEANRVIYRQINKEKLKLQARYYRQSNKLMAFDAYGGRLCCWCGDDDIESLVIDHINNDGCKHRKTLKTLSHRVYVWLRKNNYPTGFQVLCASCNQAKTLNGGVLPLDRKDRYKIVPEPIRINTYLLSQYAKLDVII